MSKSVENFTHNISDLDIKKLVQKGHFSQALALSTEFLRHTSDDQQVLYLAAVSARYLKQFELADTFNKKLCHLYPHYGRAYQETAHCAKAQNNLPKAIENYKLAVKYNSALLSSWREILNISKNDNAQSNEMAQSAIAYLESIPEALQSVLSLQNEGDIDKAENICRHFLKANPKHPEAMRLLASIGVRRSVLDEAEFILESCIAFYPDFDAAIVDYVNVLNRRQKFSLAFAQAAALLKKNPNNPAFQMLYAEQQASLNNNKKAIDYYKLASHQLYNNEVLWLSLGHTFKNTGQFEQAVESYHRAIKTRHDFGDAYWSLANLKTYQFSAEEITNMEALTHSKFLASDDRYHLYFALGKAYEDLRNYEKSFVNYQLGNQIKHESCTYSPQTTINKVERQITTFSQTKKVKNLIDIKTVTPIFIVGLPRVGSTLIEQILSSHSAIEGTLELANIINFSHQLSRQKLNGEVHGYPAIVNHLSDEQLMSLGNRYLEETKIFRTNKAFFIDKMPNNFFHIGLILSILPHSKIIDVRRNPMACCFSGYKQLFAQGQEFSYDLENIADYYLQYEKLMTHWHMTFPDKILQINYENIISDFVNQVRRLLEFVGVEFESNCLSYYHTKRSIRTPSAEQVRQPIYSSALEQWKNYEAYLGTLANRFLD